MYQHTRLYEFSTSTKVLLTGFVVAVSLAALVGVGAVYHGCRDADGNHKISFRDFEIVTRGAARSPLELAADNPTDYRLSATTEEDRQALRTWCREGAPRDQLGKILGILKGSSFGARTPENAPDADLNREYARLRPLAFRRAPLTRAQLAAGTLVYLATVPLIFLALGLMFVRTALFEKTKVFFVVVTFLLVLACPLCLWLTREHVLFIYALMLAALMLGVCLAVFAVVALYDLWLRRPAA